MFHIRNLSSSTSSSSSFHRLFAQEERHKEISQMTSQTETLAFYSDRRKFNDPKSQFKSTSTTAANSSRSAGTWNKKPGSQYFCTHCNIAGHSLDRCFKNQFQSSIKSIRTDNAKEFCEGDLKLFCSTQAHRTKFDSRANPGFFIGYPGNTKGYKSITTFPSAIYLPLVTPGSFTHTEIFPDIISDDNHPSDNLDLTVDLSPVVSPSQSATSEISEHFKIFEISLFDNAQRSPFPSNTTLVLTLNNPQPIRQSTRVHKPPDYIKDFLCHIVASTPHWCNLLQHSSLPGPHQCLISKICDIREPNSYHEASLPPLWTAAMSKEIDALNRNHTWDLVDLPMVRRLLVQNGFLK
ncbi:hypothetical protein AgCh_018399 [Apium graveolens]